MHCRTLVSTLLIVLAFGFTNTSSAWDGQRKGFVVGIGAGGGLATFKPEVESNGFFENDIEGERESQFAFMSDFKIGYAPSNQVAIYWMSKVAWFRRTEEYRDQFIQISESYTVTSGIGGLCLAYYFQPEGPSPYLTGGFGFSSWGTPFEEDSETLYGSGLSIGAGYEFSRHWSIEGNLTTGSPDDESGFSVNTMAVRVTVNVLGY